MRETRDLESHDATARYLCYQCSPLRFGIASRIGLFSFYLPWILSVVNFVKYFPVHSQAFVLLLPFTLANRGIPYIVSIVVGLIGLSPLHSRLPSSSNRSVPIVSDVADLCPVSSTARLVVDTDLCPNRSFNRTACPLRFISFSSGDFAKESQSFVKVTPKAP